MMRNLWTKIKRWLGFPRIPAPQFFAVESQRYDLYVRRKWLRGYQNGWKLGRLRR